MRKIILIALALIAAALVAVALQVRNSDRVTDLQSQPLLDEAKLSQLAAVEQIELARAGQQVRTIIFFSAPCNHFLHSQLVEVGV